MNVIDECPKCYGRKAEPGSSAETCPQCNGTGMVSKQNFYCCFIVVSSIFVNFQGFSCWVDPRNQKMQFLITCIDRIIGHKFTVYEIVLVILT